MNRKNRLRGIAAAVFCAGVFLGGIGSGIVFADVSGFSYQEIPPSQEAFATETFICSVYPEDGDKIWLTGDFAGSECVLKEQEDVPENTVEIEVEYNSQLCGIKIRKREYGEDETWIYLQVNPAGSDLGRVMRHKDEFLDGLKNHKFLEYKEEYIKRVEYRINPGDRDKFRLN